MRACSERWYFNGCRSLGRLLRSARYADARVRPCDPGEGPVAFTSRPWRVEKRRAFYAPPLVWLGSALLRRLDTGVRVLSQRAWERRETRLYRRLYGASVSIEPDGTLVLPGLPGKTLASVLDDPGAGAPVRRAAIERATAALAELHALGLTHGDAMAENVMIDLDAGVARWFDFETVHEGHRSSAWRRADDVRALLASCLVRAEPRHFEETIERVLKSHEDREVTRSISRTFASPWRRSLVFHLAQASHSYERHGRIGRLLEAYARSDRPAARGSAETSAGTRHSTCSDPCDGGSDRPSRTPSPSRRHRYAR
ncbi:MAG: hypothetical protein MJB57_05880 [Gemmatimonadetes bacterium]|nr:hypothetical protein [Gemmatimonadota bacterium]